MPKTPESIRRIANDVSDRVRSLSANARDRSRDRMRRASLELQALPSKLTPKFGDKQFLTPDFNLRGRNQTKKNVQPAVDSLRDRTRSSDSRKDMKRPRTISYERKPKDKPISRGSRSLSNRRVPSQAPPPPLQTDNQNYDQGTSHEPLIIISHSFHNHTLSL